MSFVQYPMPGYSYTSHCTSLSSCLKIKVTNTNQPKSLDFYLNLHLAYGQDSVKIPVSIQIYPCDTASLSTTGNPPEIVLMNSLQNFTFDLAPTYLSLFVSSYPVKCPILSFELLDTNSNPLAHNSIFLENGASALDSKLIVTSGTPFSYSIRIKGSTARLSTYITLAIRVCGQEVINTHSATKRSYIFGFVEGDPASLSDSERYFTIP
jgi:hypothetical protein